VKTERFDFAATMPSQPLISIRLNRILRALTRVKLIER
jgi:hypothetical protein